MIKSKSITVLLTSFILTTPVFAQISTEQMMQLGNYINSNVDPKIVKEVSKLSQCSAIAKFFDPKLSSSLLDQSYEKLLSHSEIDKKIAENYVVAGSMFFTGMLIEKKYIDPSNSEGSKTINATKSLYNKMCARLKEKARTDFATKKLIKESELTKIEIEAKKNADNKARAAELEVEHLKDAKIVAKEKEIEKERVIAEFLPLLPQCIKSDYSRLKNKLNIDSPSFDGSLVPKEQKPESFNIEGEFLIVNYTYYSYDQKKHDRWKKQNGPTAGQLFKNKAKATCLISELKNNP